MDGGRRPDVTFPVWQTPTGGTPAATVGLMHRGVDGQVYPMMTQSYFQTAPMGMVPMTAPIQMQAQGIYRIPGGQIPPRYGLQHATSGQVSYVMGMQPLPTSGLNPGTVDERQIKEKLAKERDFLMQQQRLRDFHASTAMGDQRTAADRLIRDVLGKLDEGQESKRKQQNRLLVTAVPPAVSKQEPIQRTSAAHQGQKARDWSNLEDLRNVFSSRTVTEDGLPAWCHEGSSVPLLYTRVEEYVIRSGVIDTSLLYPILVSSGLSRETLGQIWSLANRQTPGRLTKSELYAILALIALAQNACQITSLDILHTLTHPPIPLLNQVTTQPIQAQTWIPGQPPTSVPGQPTGSVPGHQTGSVPGHQTGSVPGHQTGSVPGQQTGTVPGQQTSNVPLQAENIEPLRNNIYVCPEEEDDDFDEFKSATDVPTHRPPPTASESQPSTFPPVNSYLGQSIGSRLANHHVTQSQTGMGAPSQLLPSQSERSKGAEERTTPVNHYSEEFSDFQRCTTNVPQDGLHTNIPRDQKGLFSGNGTEKEHQSLPELFSGLSLTRPKTSEKPSAFASGSDLMGDILMEDRYSVFRNLAIDQPKPSDRDRDLPKSTLEEEDEFGDFLSSNVVHSSESPVAGSASSSTFSTNSVNSTNWVSEANSANWVSEGSHGDFFGSHADRYNSQVATQPHSNIENGPCPRVELLMPHSTNVPWTMSQNAFFDATKSESAERQSDSDDEFGDFIATTEFPAVTQNGLGQKKELDSVSLHANFFKSKDTMTSFESQSVSSLDFAAEPSFWTKSLEPVSGLDWQGSVPSLDLKITEIEDDADIGLNNSTVTDEHAKPMANPPSSSSSSSTGTRYPNIATPDKLPHPAPVSVDRYSGIRTEKLLVANHCYEWQRCLDHCHQVVKDVFKTFNSVSSSDVFKELISSEEGGNYLKNVIEIYRVACRISLAIGNSNIGDRKLKNTVKEVDSEWSNLLPFIIGSPIFPSEDRFNFDHCIIHDKNEANLKLACGVCLLNVEALSGQQAKGSEPTEEDFRLAYGGRQYHCTCANFWVNFVDSLLPALPFKTTPDS